MSWPFGTVRSVSKTSCIGIRKSSTPGRQVLSMIWQCCFSVVKLISRCAIFVITVLSRSFHTSVPTVDFKLCLHRPQSQVSDCAKDKYRIENFEDTVGIVAGLSVPGKDPHGIPYPLERARADGTWESQDRGFSSPLDYYKLVDIASIFYLFNNRSLLLFKVAQRS